MDAVLDTVDVNTVLRSVSVPLSVSVVRGVRRVSPIRCVDHSAHACTQQMSVKSILSDSRSQPRR